MKIRFLCVVAGLLLASSQAFAATAIGKVTDEIGGGVKLADEKGGELTLNYERGIKYIPEDYRAYKGDKIEVTYEKKEVRGKEVNAVSEVKLIELDPANAELKSPQTGKITEVGRSGYKIMLDSNKRIERFEFARGMPEVPNELKNPEAGAEVKVFFTRVPSKFGRGYVYQLHGFQAK